MGDSLLSDNAKISYFAVLLVLVFLLVYYSMKSSKERFGLPYGGVPDAVFTSGATMRNLGTGFSQPGQGDVNTPSAVALAAAVPSLVAPVKPPAPAGKEYLVNTGGYPDFWTITSELGAYRDQTASDWKQQGQVAANNPEFFTPGSPEGQLMAQNLLSNAASGLQTASTDLLARGLGQ